MAGLEALESEHAQLAAGEVVERGAPHRSQPDHDRIVSSRQAFQEHAFLAESA